MTLPTNKTLHYPSHDPDALPGACRDLLPHLAEAVPYDGVVVEMSPAPARKSAALLFRKGAKTIYRISIVRRTGCYLVRLSGGDPVEVLKVVRACRDHFDQWFGIEAIDIDPTRGDEHPPPFETGGES